LKIIRKIKEFQKYSDEKRRQGKTICLVPTMGALHEGHLSLIRRARSESDVVAVSIFVNPTQFGPEEDYAKYPRNFKKDSLLCKKAGADVLFYPSAREMYPERRLTTVSVAGLSQKLCALSRPGHFEGVATVVCKLFNIAKPHIAYFGKKDFQQFLIVRKMAKDLNIDVRIKGGATVREKDGLALSSRNRYLSKKERREAVCLNEALRRAEYLIKEIGMRDCRSIVKEMKSIIRAYPSTRVDYINITDAETLEDVRRIKGRVLIAMAVFVGKTRLIDNTVV